jgi:hypothetical protein
MQVIDREPLALRVDVDAAFLPGAEALRFRS